MSGTSLTQQQIQTLLDQLDPRQRAAFQRMDQHQRQALLRRLQERQPPPLYQVFRPERDSAAHDPLDPVKRYHDGVFVEVYPENGKGTLFHVTGDIIARSGMRYEENPNFSPGQSARLHRSTPIRVCLKADFETGRISSVVRRLPTPTKQQGVNFWKKSDAPGGD